MQDALVSECEKAVKRGTSTEAPWILTPYQLVSWWDMQKFSAERFVHIGTILRALKEEVGLSPVGGDPAFDFSDQTEITITLESYNEIVKSVDYMARVCDEISLKVTVAT